MDEKEFQNKVLAGVESVQKEQAATTKSVTELQAAHKQTAGVVVDLQAAVQKQAEELNGFRKQQLTAKASQIIRPGQVSKAAAIYMAAIAITAAMKDGGALAGLDGHRKTALVASLAEGLGVDTKAALTTSDTPLPVEYSGEVVELVSAYGAARRFGTVYPCGAGSNKLPRLKTDTAFGLISMSGSVTEKSPQFEFVDLNPAKWGGLIRIPSEIDADSVVAIGQFIARYAARQLARIEDTVFFIADGSGAYNSLSGLCASTITNSKVVQMASTKTKYSDATLANWRAIRAVVDAPVIGFGAYYCHPSMEQMLNSYNASGDKPFIGGANPTLDGYPVKYVDVMPAYSTSANASKTFVLFGDLSYQYLGVRGGVSIESSREAGFTTDEILVRAMERFSIGLMATGAVSGLETAAS